jgi:four helix bundle protein
MGKISTFTDLETWKEGHKLVIAVYKILPTIPRSSYSLIDQLSRCVVSITSNIAEGFSRQSKKEKIQFYHIAKGSLTELQNQLLICRDVGFITQKEFLPLAEQTIVVGKLLTGLIRSAQSYQ